MGKGLSWQQRHMLWSIAYIVAKRLPADGDPIVSWRDVSYDAKAVLDETQDTLSPRVLWNIEQSTRRALRSLEDRGLVELGRYVFYQAALEGGDQWRATDPENHIPGQTRIMTGVKLTARGRAVAQEQETERVNRST